MTDHRNKTFEISDEIGRSAARVLQRIDRATDSPNLSFVRDGEHLGRSYAINREGHVRELEQELKRCRELEEKHGQTIRQMRHELETTELESSELSKSRKKAQVTISDLEEDSHKLRDRIAGLENKIRRQLEGKEQFTNYGPQHCERNYDQLHQAICKIIFQDGISEERTHETVLQKLQDYADEQTKLRLQSLKLQNELFRAKEEARVEMESLKKVLDELEKTKINATAIELLQEEKYIATRKQKEAEDKLRKMEECLFRDQERHENLQRELRNYQSKLTDFDSLTRRYNLAAQTSSLELKSFKETLAALISEIYPSVQPTEESLKEKIRQLMINKREANQVFKQLEEKLRELSEQLEEQAHLHKNAVQRSRKAEEELEKFRERQNILESELTATDILKNGLKADKHKYIDFCQQLAHVMKLDKLADELGTELNGDALLARAEQLCNSEQDNISKSNAKTAALEKQLKDAQALLHSKDLHLEVLKKKLTNVEAEASQKAEKDWQELDERHQRLKRHNEKLVSQLTESKMTVDQMAKHGETAETLRRTCENQRTTIQDLEKQLADSEHARAKLAKKIQQLKMDNDIVQPQHNIRATEASVEPLLEEMQGLKQQLTGVVQREKQLLDLRQVISRMLGLDAQTLAVPDYEIIRRLESMIESQNELALANRKSYTDYSARRSQQSSNLVKSKSFGGNMDRTISEKPQSDRRQVQLGQVNARLGGVVRQFNR